MKFKSAEPRTVKSMSVFDIRYDPFPPPVSYREGQTLRILRERSRAPEIL